MSTEKFHHLPKKKKKKKNNNNKNRHDCQQRIIRLWVVLLLVCPRITKKLEMGSFPQHARRLQQVMSQPILNGR
eukprot:scaffold35199_cov191-Amphora_coffeaeformis.AAC.1